MSGLQGFEIYCSSVCKAFEDVYCIVGSTRVYSERPSTEWASVVVPSLLGCFVVLHIDEPHTFGRYTEC